MVVAFAYVLEADAAQNQLVSSELEVIKLNQVNKDLASSLAAIEEAIKVSARLEEERLKWRMAALSVLSLVLVGLIYSALSKYSALEVPTMPQSPPPLLGISESSQTQLNTSVSTQTVSEAPNIGLVCSQTIDNSRFSDLMDFGPLGVGLKGEILPLAGENTSIAIAIAEKFSG